MNNRGARWYSVAVLSDGAELVSAQDVIVLLGRRRPGRRRRLGRQRVFGQLGTAGQIRWCAGITEATRPFNRKWGVAAGGFRGTKPTKAGPPPVFAATGDFFAGVQGDKNAISVTFCNPTRPHDAKNAIGGGERTWARVTKTQKVSPFVTPHCRISTLHPPTAGLP